LEKTTLPIKLTISVEGDNDKALDKIDVYTDFVIEPDLILKSGDIITLTGHLKRVQEMPLGGGVGTISEVSVLFLDLDKPIRCLIEDDDAWFAENNRYLLESVQIQTGNIDDSYVNQTVTVTGKVMFGHTQYHFRNICLLDAFVLDEREIIQFGGYDWCVLDVQDGKTLLLSDRVLEERAYHNEYGDTTWEQCDLRAYLNGSFLENFNSTERAKIIQTTIVNNDNPWYGTSGGNNTTDRVFLLSLEEVVKYFGDSGQFGLGNGSGEVWAISDEYDSSRIAYDKNNNACMWRLRSPGIYSGGSVSFISENGILAISASGNVHNNNAHGVRPAMWVNL